MKKILKIQFIIFSILTFISLFTLGNIWLPLMMLLSIIIGPWMAYYYPHGLMGHSIITITFLVAGLLMYYGIKKQNHNRGVLAFISGFWIWGLIGLVAGLGTGT